MRHVLLVALTTFVIAAPPGGGRPATAGIQSAADIASPALFDEWVRLARAHEAGTWDPPANRLAELTDRDLNAILESVRRGRLQAGLRMVDRHLTDRDLALAAILHADVALLRFYETNRPDGVSWGGRALRHLSISERLVATFDERRTSEPFVRAWRLAVEVGFAVQLEVQVAPRFIDTTLARFPRDPDLLLVAGGVFEFRASPRVQEAPEILDLLRGRAVDNLHRAEEYYRRAIQADSVRHEARVRLGRVLAALGRHEDALAEYETAARGLEAAGSTTTTDRDVPYLLWLFEGESLDALNRPDAARRSIQRALAFHPNASSALLALSRVELRDGRRDASRAAVARMAASAGADADDPWRYYPFAGPAKHPDGVIAALVAAVPAK
jgi:tetratricopeptide (TPR) repeat protein